MYLLTGTKNFPFFGEESKMFLVFLATVRSSSRYSEESFMKDRQKLG